MTKNQTIGVIGAGTMGVGIALSALYVGNSVILQDKFPNVLDKAEKYIQKFLNKKDLSKYSKNISFATELGSLKEANIVIEAAPESLDIKRQLLSELEEICSPQTIFATNTSTLSVTQISAKLKFPESKIDVPSFLIYPIIVSGLSANSNTF